MRTLLLVTAQAALLLAAMPSHVAAPKSSSPSAIAAVAAAATPTRAVSDTTRVHLGPADGGTDMFVAWPAGRDPAPGVVVIQEWWGLNAQIRDVAKRFARQGYVAVVPDLYHGKVPIDEEGAHELVRGLEDEAALADLQAAIEWLRKEPRVGKQPIGVVGFCMGGALSERLALKSAEVSAAVMFYGRPITDAESIAKLRAPLQGHFGAEDQGIPVAKVKEFETALKKAGKDAEVYVYPGAGHAFMNDTRPSHSPDAARQAWARTLAFFQKHLKRAP